MAPIDRALDAMPHGRMGLHTRATFVAALSCVIYTACSVDRAPLLRGDIIDGGAGTTASDSGAGVGGSSGSGGSGGSVAQCTGNDECDDGAYCNGGETCAPDSGPTLPNGCTVGVVPCSDTQTCNEMNHTCTDCPNGQCVNPVCPTGYEDCDRNPSNGCEVALNAVVGDCMTASCQNPVPSSDPLDLPPDDGNACTVETCNLGMFPTRTLLTAGTSCGFFASCDANGQCIPGSCQGALAFCTFGACCSGTCVMEVCQ